MKAETPEKALIGSVGRSLLAEHAELETLLEQLLNASESIDSTVLQGVWTEFEELLGRHLEFEETRIFPKAERQQPATVAYLRREHEKIRALVATLGVGADLHTVRRAGAEALVRLLREHASYEERTLYPLADAALAEAGEL